MSEEIEEMDLEEVYYDEHKEALEKLDNAMRDLGFQVDEYENEQPITKPVSLTIEQHQAFMDALGEFLGVCVGIAIFGSSDRRLREGWEAEFSDMTPGAYAAELRHKRKRAKELIARITKSSDLTGGLS